MQTIRDLIAAIRELIAAINALRKAMPPPAPSGGGGPGEPQDSH